MRSLLLESLTKTNHAETLVGFFTPVERHLGRLIEPIGVRMIRDEIASAMAEPSPQKWQD